MWIFFFDLMFVLGDVEVLVFGPFGRHGGWENGQSANLRTSADGLNWSILFRHAKLIPSLQGIDHALAMNLRTETLREALDPPTELCKNRHLWPCKRRHFPYVQYLSIHSLYASVNHSVFDAACKVKEKIKQTTNDCVFDRQGHALPRCLHCTKSGFGLRI